jgi:hypothetical protein
MGISNGIGRIVVEALGMNILGINILGMNRIGAEVLGDVQT